METIGSMILFGSKKQFWFIAYLFILGGMGVKIENINL